MTSTWDPRLESWGLPYYFSPGDNVGQESTGPLGMGRVFGVETVKVEEALDRVVASDILAELAVPCRPLSAVCGKAIRSEDTETAGPKRQTHLDDLGRVAGLLGTGEDEPVLIAKQSHPVDPFSLLLRGADAVLSHMSTYYDGTSLGEKLKKKIVMEVPAGTDVIAVGKDFNPGKVLLHKGRRVSVGDIAALCMAGVVTVEAFARPRVAVCIINKYFQDRSGQDGGNGLPDGITPMVLALLARWGVKVDTVRKFDFVGRMVHKTTSAAINSISEEHDLTITIGFLGDKLELDSISSQQKMNPIEEPNAAPDSTGTTYSAGRGLFRPADISRIFLGGEFWKEDARVDRCKVVVAMQGLPLPVFASMYTMVKPILDALSGVGAFPVQRSNHFGFGSPRDLRSFPNADEKRQFLSRPKPGMSGRHGVRWFTGVLCAPAPRDPERHWLQLAILRTSETGHAGLQVLPSEEYQVSGLIGAEAMVAIERGSGDMPAGTVVQFFLLD